MRKSRLWVGLILAFAGHAFAAGGAGVALDRAPVDVGNKISLQSGARLFVNYCMGCHSADYSRYSRVADDLGLTTLQMEDNLIFTDAKIRDPMKIAMPKGEAAAWFGAAPPDLSLVARAKGADWLYTYLRSFYLDETRPLGVNNLVLANASMPHVLWELQGWQVHGSAAAGEGQGGDDAHTEHAAPLELVQEGTMTTRDFDRAVGDLVNFLVYLSEPAQLKRKEVGIWVLLFLVLLFVVTYALKKEYWRDVH